LSGYATCLLHTREASTPQWRERQQLCGLVEFPQLSFDCWVRSDRLRWYSRRIIAFFSSTVKIFGTWNSVRTFCSRLLNRIWEKNGLLMWNTHIVSFIADLRDLTGSALSHGSSMGGPWWNTRYEVGSETPRGPGLATITNFRYR